MKKQLVIALFPALFAGVCAQAEEKTAAPPPPAKEQPAVQQDQEEGAVTVSSGPVAIGGQTGSTMVVSTSGKMIISENGKTRVLTMKDGKWVEEKTVSGAQPVTVTATTATGPVVTGAGTITAQPGVVVTGGGRLTPAQGLLPLLPAPASDEELDKRLAKAKLLETRPDGVKVYEEADGTKIYKGDHSLMIVSKGATTSMVQMGTVPGGAGAMLGNISVSTGPNGEIMISDHGTGMDPAEIQMRMEAARAKLMERLQNGGGISTMPAPAAVPAMTPEQRSELLKRRAELMQKQAERMQQQAEEMKALADKLLAEQAQEKAAPAPAPK
jgi:hypothetical protein